MRVAAIVAAAFVLAVTAALAEPIWTAAGWYQVADTIEGPFLIEGPFETEEECTATLPPDEEEAEYSCEYLTERPEWDE